jgi:ADP-heptose:LPS heptosyltransferase
MVWRAGGFGDLLFIRPCPQKLKELYPTCTIIFGTRADYFDVLKDWECIDSVVPVPLMAWNGYNLADYHLSFHGIVESCREAEQIDIHDIFARHCRLDPDNVEWNTPMVARPPVVGDKEDALQYQYLHKGGYVVVQPRPSAPLRTPLMGSMVAAINAATAQGLPVFVTDTPARFQEVDSLISCCERPDMVHRFNGRGLSDVIRLITWARLVVAPDSAGMHIAAAQGVPSIGLYGPFPGRVRCSRYPLAKWVETPLDPGCCKSGGRECFLHRMEACDSQYSCWKNLDNAKLAAMIKEALS